MMISKPSMEKLLEKQTSSLIKAFIMSEQVSKKNIFYYIGLACGVLAIVSCLVSLGLSVGDSYYSIYSLCMAIIFLGINRIGLHLSNFKKNMFENIFLTAFIFVLALMVGLTKYSIYFLVTAMFCYSITIIINCLLKIKENKTTQNVIFNSLCIVFVFLFSFVFFFPAIYAKHASSVSNSNFIVLCFCSMIIVSSGKNILLPYHFKLKLHVISNIIKKSMIKEIFLSLLILIVLCSCYFTAVEPNITSYVDGLWYSFAVVTTIGFGDVYVVTTFGRILSVILGISGIAIVAVITSFIVNFYNEMNKKREDKTLKQILSDVEEIEKKDNKEKEE